MAEVEQIKNIPFRPIPILPTQYDDALSYQELLYRVNNKLTEVINVVNAFSDTVFERCKEYTDTAIDAEFAVFQQQYDQLVVAVDQFQQTVNAAIKGVQDQFDAYAEKTTAEVLGAKAYTDVAIQQNNEYLLEEISNYAISVRVLNPFTGQRVSVQEMVNYLSAFHMTNAILVRTLEARNNTVNQMIAYNVKCTDLVLNGNNIIQQH